MDDVLPLDNAFLTVLGFMQGEADDKCSTYLELTVAMASCITPIRKKIVYDNHQHWSS